MFNLKYRLLDKEGGDGGNGDGGGEGEGNDDGVTTILNNGEGGDDEGGKGGEGEEGKGGGEGDAGKWGEDWRQNIAASITGKAEGEEYEKEVKRLERYTSPDKIYSSYRNLEQKMSSGEFKKPLPENATEEDIAKYRKEHGIPDKFDGYYNALGDIEVKEDDKPIFDDLFESVLHPKNTSPEIAKELVNWWYQMSESAREEQHDNDSKMAAETEEVLREEWGKDYRTNVGYINNWLARAPESIRTAVQDARMPDGTPLFNNKDFIQYVANEERMNYPVATLAGGGASTLQDVESEIAEIKKKMPTAEYKKDEAMQKRYRDLVTMRDRLSSKQ